MAHLPDHNQLRRYPKNWASLFMVRNKVMVGTIISLLFFFFLSLKAAEATRDLHLDIWEHPQPEAVWADWVTQSEDTFKVMRTPVRLYAVFIGTCHPIAHIRVCSMCLVCAYQTSCIFLRIFLPQRHFVGVSLSHSIII